MVSRSHAESYVIYKMARRFKAECGDLTEKDFLSEEPLEVVQGAIDRAHEEGLGVVRVTPANYEGITVEVKVDVNLIIEPGVTNFNYVRNDGAVVQDMRTRSLEGIGSIDTEEASIDDADIEDMQLGEFCEYEVFEGIVDKNVMILLQQTGTISNTNLNGAYSVFVRGNYAYVASRDADSLTIIDISDPTSPSQVGTISNADLEGAISVFVRGNYAYVASYTADALTIIDISDPANPSQTGTISNTDLEGALSVFVRGNYAYVASRDADSLTVIGASSLRTGETKTFVKIVNYDDSSPVTVANVEDGYAVTDCWVEVTTTWDGSVQMQIGDGNDVDGFLCDSGGTHNAIDLTSTGYYGVEDDQREAYLWDDANGHGRTKVYTGTDTIDATISSDGTQGEAVIYLKVTRIG